LGEKRAIDLTITGEKPPGEKLDFRPGLCTGGLMFGGLFTGGLMFGGLFT